MTLFNSKLPSYISHVRSYIRNVFQKSVFPLEILFKLISDMSRNKNPP